MPPLQKPRELVEVAFRKSVLGDKRRDLRQDLGLPVPANELLAEVHNEKLRMPAVLREETTPPG